MVRFASQRSQGASRGVSQGKEKTGAGGYLIVNWTLLSMIPAEMA
jgi:hypothetical protein